jgi:hypothetical protein
MAKRTTKYVRALEVAEHLAIAEVNNQEALYQLLNGQEYFWDAERKVWEQTSEVAQPATKFIRVRVWTDSKKVQVAADDIKAVLSVLDGTGYELIEESRPYVCRPPNQLDSRIYLVFRKRD